MGENKERRAVLLGVRIGLIFLAAVGILIFTAYFVLSQSFHRLLTEYSITLTRSMLNQGVHMLESELKESRREILFTAGAFSPPPKGEAPDFPAALLEGEDVLRVFYYSGGNTVASDGLPRDLGDREDVRAALSGETGMCGPYYDENGEFIVSYAAPVYRDGELAGVLGVEKDGYLFCRIIAPIRFVDSGESYLINAEGTDIAVSDQNHLEWVTSQYNGQRLLEEHEDPVTRAIVELEAKGLRGETGVGTYTWNDGLVYVLYQPVPSTGWVLLGGLREEEIAAMTQSAIFSGLARGPAFLVCFFLFLALAGLIVFWIVTSMKKNAEINKHLERMANQDALTGLLNRRFMESELVERWRFPVRISGPAAVFMLDIDNFKKYNDFYGHQMGDDCLRTVADVFRDAFLGTESYVVRYGGEELVATAFLMDRAQALEKGEEICRMVEGKRLPTVQDGVVTVSVGVCHVRLTSEISLYDCIKTADQALYRAKREGKNRAVLLDSPGPEPGK